MVIFTISATQCHQAWGATVAVISAIFCLYWGFAYRRLER